MITFIYGIQALMKITLTFFYMEKLLGVDRPKTYLLFVFLDGGATDADTVSTFYTEVIYTCTYIVYV